MRMHFCRNCEAVQLLWNGEKRGVPAPTNCACDLHGYPYLYFVRHDFVHEKMMLSVFCPQDININRNASKQADFPRGECIREHSYETSARYRLPDGFFY
jgi:hypothetical protein